MPLSTYDVSVSVYRRILGAIPAILDKAAAEAEAKGVAIGDWLSARLAPDMWTLAEQVKAACNHAVRGPARLAGLPPPDLTFGDASIADLKARIAAALAFLATVTPEMVDAGVDREIVFPSGGSERRMAGRDYLLKFSLPNFYFHATTAYDILRHKGVPLKKSDFLGE